MTHTATVEEWEKMFRPITNTIDDDPSWQDLDGNGIMFFTSGDGHDFVCRHNLTRQVWTWVDGTDGTYIVNGYSFANRIGYFVTEVPYDSDDDWEIKVDDFGDIAR
jgi:hypothetical protein